MSDNELKAEIEEVNGVVILSVNNWTFTCPNCDLENAEPVVQVWPDGETEVFCKRCE